MWESGTEQEVEDAFNRYANWTPEGVQLLQEAHLGGDIGALCIADDIGVSLIAHCIINLCTYCLYHAFINYFENHSTHTCTHADYI